MRLAALVVTLALGSILGNGTAKAFDCTGATLASSIVICSDPELMRLTDERQEAIKEARGRIGEEAWPDLWETKRLGFDPTLRPAASNKIGRHQCRFRRQSERASNVPPKRELASFGGTVWPRAPWHR